MNKLLYLINNHYNNLIDNNNNKTVKKLNLSNLVKCVYDNLPCTWRMCSTYTYFLYKIFYGNIYNE